jgi:hypothetical protein
MVMDSDTALHLDQESRVLVKDRLPAKEAATMAKAKAE